MIYNLIKEFQSKGLSESSKDSENFNIVMRNGKLIIINTIGTEILQKFIKQIHGQITSKALISEKNLESYFFDDCFNLITASTLKEDKVDKQIHSFISKLNDLLKKKFLIAIPISGLSIKREFNLLNYKLITIKTFKKKFKSYFNFTEAKLEYSKILQNGDCIALIEDFGELKTLREKHTKEIDNALDLLRLFIPHFWNHSYQVSITVANKRDIRISSCYIFSEPQRVNINRSVTTRQHLFEIDSKRMPNDSHTIRQSLKRLNFQNLNTIILNETTFSNKLSTSLKWIGLYTKENDLNLKFLFLIFSLEVLFPNENNNYSSITATISEKVAFLINKTETGRQKTFQHIKKFYLKRSSIVHGSNNTISDSDLFSLYHIVLNVYYSLVDLIIKKKIKTQNDLDEYILHLKFT